MNRHVRKLFAALGSRLARNIYIWVFLLYTALDLNYNNEQAYHYGFIHSRWYYGMIVVGMLLQMALVYGNNLLIVPRLLARKKYLLYIGAIVLLNAGISMLYTVALKITQGRVDTNHMQQMSFSNFPVTTDWRLGTFFSEAQTYFWGNVLWIFVFTMAWYMNDYSRQQRRAEQALREQKNTELAFLKNQLNPHFLFNTMNNLYSLTLKKSDLAPDAVLKLSLILRYLLYESDSPLVPFEKEQEIMEAYIDLELLRLRDKDRLQFSITSDNARPIPPLLWMPVLENIFKHGTRIISSEHYVEYRYHLAGDRLSIYSRNSVRSGNGTIRTADKGIGLDNLAKRLALLYPGKHSLKSGIQQNEYITEVNIDLS